MVLTAPSNPAPTLALGCGRIQWFLSVSLSWGLKTAQAKVPIVMQPACPRHLVQFPVVPVFGASEQYTGPSLFQVSQDDVLPWWSLGP